MSEKEKPTSKLFWIGIAGVVSLIVGITSTLVVNYLTDDAPKLTYDITSLEIFPGATQRLGIVAILVENAGKKEIEALQCRIQMKNATLTEPRIKGLSAASPTINYEKSHVDVSVPYLNPKESFSLQLLVEPKDDTLELPDIDIRGKGIVATAKAIAAKRSGSTFEALLPIFATIAAALGTASIGREKFLRRGGGLGVQQRDGFAFLLGLHGFTKDAAELRLSPRAYSWWTLSDALTERILDSKCPDTEVVSRAMSVLESVVDHQHTMARTSKAIINTNLARLAIAQEDSAAAKLFVQTANDLDKRTSELRCETVPELRRFTNDGWLTKEG